MKRNHDKEYEGSLLTKKILEEKQKRKELNDKLDEENAKIAVIYLLIGIGAISLILGLMALILSNSEPIPF
ncbi:hypothetical protein LMK05_07235 [Lactococcus petauri]|nr:hypothetical protein LMK05_07235 [Lactococcus petauri]